MGKHQVILADQPFLQKPYRSKEFNSLKQNDRVMSQQKRRKSSTHRSRVGLSYLRSILAILLIAGIVEASDGEAEGGCRMNMHCTACDGENGPSCASYWHGY